MNTSRDNTNNRTAAYFEGSLIESILLDTTGIKIYRKGGGQIDVAAYVKDQRVPLTIDYNGTEAPTKEQ